MDLNTLVDTYTISRSEGVKELHLLQHCLAHVPISLGPLKGALAAYRADFSDLCMHAFLERPRLRIDLLSEIMDYDEADAITARIALPYPLIEISARRVSEYFYEGCYGRLGELIVPTRSDARVLGCPDFGAAAVLYHCEGKVGYVEFWISVATETFITRSRASGEHGRYAP